jgi:hypothetical protein
MNDQASHPYPETTAVTNPEPRSHADGDVQPGDAPAVTVTPKRWYQDPSKVVGVLGFLLALGTLGERMWVRQQEQTLQRLQQLRDVTSALADIQYEYLDALAAAPSNVYAIGVAKNTKRQMYLQTAAALLTNADVKAQASAQIFVALSAEMMSDGRYEDARTYLALALSAPGADEATKPYLLRSLGQLYRVPDVATTDIDASRDYFRQSLAIFDKRTDDAGLLMAAETVLTEASLEVAYGDLARTKVLTGQAKERLGKVRTLSPLKTQLERLASAFERGEQYQQTQHGGLQQSTAPGSEIDHPAAAANMAVLPVDFRNDKTSPTFIEIWSPVTGQLSGAEMDVSVDGRPVGHLSNLAGKNEFRLGDLSAGVHTFAFTNMKVYFIDPAKGASKTAEGFGCGGIFQVAAARTVLKVNIGSGQLGVMCTLQ